MKRALLPLFLLAGCAGSPPVDVSIAPIDRPLLRYRIPKSALACLPEPLGAKVVTARDAADLIIDTRAAGRDCRSKLSAVRSIIENEQ
jgi:hypothetical protein